MTFTKISRSIPQDPPPTEPVVPCLECGEDFVWWLHPIQACDECVEKMYREAEKENQ